MLSDLISTNGGCQLPCWWGIMPGKSSWVATRQFLETFSTYVGQGGTNEYHSYGVKHVATSYTFEYKSPVQSAESFASFSVLDDVIIGIDVNSANENNEFQLHKLLADYGKPEHIYLQTYPAAPFPAIPFRLLLSYPNRGISALYEFGAERVGKEIISCQAPTQLRLELWEPYRDYGIPGALSLERSFEMRLGAENGLKELPNVTDLSIDSFYQSYIGPNSDLCLKTPADLWGP